MTQSPDGRLFVTGMHALYDNKKGKVFILEDWDADEKRFKTTTVWKDKLHNPNSVAFYTDKTGREWLYMAVTGKLVRYQYVHGELEPSSEEQLVATFPDYGLDYKHGGWHLTRIIAIHNDKIYVSVGSSCNSCEEKTDERLRASILKMDPDGSNLTYYAEGVRNAVDIKWIQGKLYGTN